MSGVHLSPFQNFSHSRSRFLVVFFRFGVLLLLFCILYLYTTHMYLYYCLAFCVFCVFFFNLLRLLVSSIATIITIQLSTYLLCICLPFLLNSARCLSFQPVVISHRFRHIVHSLFLCCVFFFFFWSV